MHSESPDWSMFEKVEMGELADLLFSGVQERPMWGRFLSALAKLLDAQIAGIVITADNRQHEDMALLAGVGEDVTQLRLHVAGCDLAALPVGLPTGTGDGGVAVRFALDKGRSACLVIAVPPERAATVAEGQVLEALIPLLARVLPLYLVIGDSERRRLVAEHVLETSGVGVILVDAERQVISINRVAETIVQSGGVLTIRDGRLAVLRATEHKALARFIREMAEAQTQHRVSGRHTALALLRDADAVPVTVMVQPGPPFGPVSAPLRRTATVILRDPARRIGLVSADLVHLFGLTPAEARLACLLGDGADLEECALQLGVTRNTARTQLRAIFAKTGTNRQGDLVRLLLTSTASNAQRSEDS